ncbi:MAG: phosphatidate cytidylyltransferase [Lentisphaeria bacterium]|nr:phosphatidate cytidylyltransferase [Lentisphaeria bacterium]NQZ71388.1 phosphatidate cytidylyltransferase [Lentisphaeria bacterium]
MLKYRLISGFSLVALLGLSVFWENRLAGIVFTVLAAVFVTLCLLEYFRMVQAIGESGNLTIKGFPSLTVYLSILYISGIGCIGYICTNPQLTMGKKVDLMKLAVSSLDIIIPALLLIIGFILVFKRGNFKEQIMNVIVSLAGYLYLAWTLGFLVKIYYIDQNENPCGPFLVFFLVIVSKFNDIGGYTCGNICNKIFGKTHKLIPSVSPGKSWEGFVGSLVFSSAIAYGLIMWKGDLVFPGMFGQVVLFNSCTAIVAGLILATLGLLGDLAASALKRASGLKDTGSIIPGMGGMLDVLDSLILVSPVFYIYLHVMIR